MTIIGSSFIGSIFADNVSKGFFSTLMHDNQQQIPVEHLSPTGLKLGK
jgi:hypothetical protein